MMLGEKKSEVGDILNSVNEAHTTFAEIEKNSERSKEVREKYQTKRLELLKGILAERLRSLVNSPELNKIANALPVVGDAIMAVDVLRNKEGNRLLSPRERFVYTLVVLMNLTATALAAEGDFSTSVKLKVATATLQYMETLPTLLLSGGQKIQSHYPKTGNLLSKSADFLIAVREGMYGQFDFSDEIIQLHLRNI